MVWKRLEKYLFNYAMFFCENDFKAGWSWQLFPATRCGLLFGYSMMGLKPNSVLKLFAF